MMKSISLNGQWKLKGKEQEGGEAFISLNANVPGEVQLDLSAAGYLPEDLFMGKNILETEKYEGWEWWYERSFTAPANCTARIGEFPVYYSEKRMFIIKWETADGTGFNHYTAGNVPLDFEKYKKWLEKLNNI